MLRRALPVGLAVLVVWSWSCAGGDSRWQGKGACVPRGEVRQERARGRAPVTERWDTASNTREITPGIRVRIAGLVNAVELNGQIGVTVWWWDSTAEGGSWRLRVGGRTVDVKQKNLAVVEDILETTAFTMETVVVETAVPTAGASYRVGTSAMLVESGHEANTCRGLIATRCIEPG